MVETLEMVDMIGKKTTDGKRNNYSSHKNNSSWIYSLHIVLSRLINNICMVIFKRKALPNCNFPNDFNGPRWLLTYELPWQWCCRWDKYWLCASRDISEDEYHKLSFIFKSVIFIFGVQCKPVNFGCIFGIKSAHYIPDFTVNQIFY